MNLKGESEVRRVKHYSYRTHSMIGKGAAGKVYEGFNERNGEKVAIKIMEMSKIDNQVTQYLLACQKQALLSISNPHVLNAYDIIQTQDQCLIITPLCEGGTLKQHITAKGKLAELEALHILVKLLRGYAAIKNKGFIHRDIKSSNVMFRKGEPVIIDFGYCEQASRKKPQMFYNVGSPSYMSPEAYFKSLYSEKSDLWSLGMILYEMIEGFTIDHGQPIDRYFSALLKHGFALREKISQPVKAILKSVLNPNFHDRPSVQQLVQSIENIIFQGNWNQQIYVPQFRATNLEQGQTENGYNGKISLKKQRKNQQLQQMLTQSRQKYEFAKFHGSNSKKIQQQGPFLNWNQQADNKLTIFPQPISMPALKYTSVNTNNSHPPNYQIQPKSDHRPQSDLIPPNSQPLTSNHIQVQPSVKSGVQHSQGYSQHPVQSIIRTTNHEKGFGFRSMLPENTCAPLDRPQRLVEPRKVFHSQIINTESILTMEEKPFVSMQAQQPVKAQIQQDRQKYLSANEGWRIYPNNLNSVAQSVIIEPHQNNQPNKSTNPVFKSLIVESYPTPYPINVKFIQAPPQILPQPHHRPQQLYLPNYRPMQNNYRQAPEKGPMFPQNIYQPLSPVANERILGPVLEGRREDNRLIESMDRNFVKKAAPYFHMNSKRIEESHGRQFRQTMPNGNTVWKDSKVPNQFSLFGRIRNS